MKRLPTKSSELEEPEASSSRQTQGRASGLTLRAMVLGILFTALTDLWIHWAELVLGGRGHTALANTSIPIGAFNMLFLLVVVNIFLKKVLKPLAFSPAELLVIYVMMTVSTVVSSSGGIHFVVPTITAAFYYATDSNGWAGQFHQYIPDWIALKNKEALTGFYVGNAAVPWSEWVKPFLTWLVFLVVFTFATLCIVAILRRQWMDRERLNFPTVAVPIEMLRDSEGFFSNRLLWMGFAIPFAIDVLNTMHLNFPTLPFIPTRTTDRSDISVYFTLPPWNSIGWTPLSFYPFVIGIAYLLSVELTFSCFFFWLLTKSERIFGAASGLSAGATGGGQSVFPFIGHQGAGSFLALTLVGLYLSRSYLKEIWGIAFGKEKGKREKGKVALIPEHLNTRTPEHPAPDADEPMSYRWAFIGLLLCLFFSVGWCMAAGMRSSVAFSLIVLSLFYMIAAARIRAETGNAWLFGPEIDAYKVMTTTFGTSVYHPADLTILAYVRNAIASFDLRCLSMPNQFDAYKMADTLNVSKRRLTFALMLAIAIGIAVSIAIGLMIWYTYGAGSKADAWRTSMGREPFDQLSDVLKTPVKADLSGSMAIGAGFLITTALMLLRTRFTWWTLHPVGYAMANTSTMNQVWMPFFIAWILKVFVLRYGGMRLYRLSLPFFYGVIVGDFLAGGLTTLLGCFTGINVYPINW